MFVHINPIISIGCKYHVYLKTMRKSYSWLFLEILLMLLLRNLSLVIRKSLRTNSMVGLYSPSQQMTLGFSIFYYRSRILFFFTHYSLICLSFPAIFPLSHFQVPYKLKAWLFKSSFMSDILTSSLPDYNMNVVCYFLIKIIP